MRALLVALGKNPAGEHLSRTPGRVARSYAELLSPRAFDLITFPNEDGYDELVLARDIPVQSLPAPGRSSSPSPAPPVADPLAPCRTASGRWARRDRKL